VIVVLLLLVVLGVLPLFEIVDDVRLPPPPSISVSGDGPDDAGGVGASRHALVVWALPRVPERGDIGRILPRIDGRAPGRAPRRPHESRGPPLLLPAA
jgi:hypothetical protein